MTSFFHTVNSGVIIKTNNSEFFIDVFHTGKEVGLSDTPSPVLDDLIKKRENQGQTKVILATHSHPDHFNESMFDVICHADKKYLCYCPGYKKSNISFTVCENSLSYFDTEDVRCYMTKSIHQGAQFKDVDNRAYILKCDNKIYIFLGDTELTEPIVKQLKMFGNAEAIFVNYYHLASPTLTAYIRSGDVKTVFLYHLPFEKDDMYHCRLCASQVMKGYPSEILQPEILRPMNRFKIE